MICEKCGSDMRVIAGKFGSFYGCKNYPNCKNTVKITSKKYVRKTFTKVPHVAVTGSPEQEAIWNEIANGTGHVIVKAFAGTGKSFTCREAMHRTNSSLRVLYVAFNAAIVEEFKPYAPDHAEVVTLNSIGNTICRNSFGNVEFNNYKVENIIRELHQPSTKQEIENEKILVATVKTLVALAQSYLVESPADLIEIATRHEVELHSDIVDLALSLVGKVLKLDRERTGVINYNDQLWLPITLNLPTPKYDLIFVDEAQDLNKVQHQLVMRLLAPTGRVVVVGDDNQAIFGFRGSDVDSIANFSKLLNETGKNIKTMPLTITRRCGKQIVAAAQEYVSDIQAMPDAKEGCIIETDLASAKAMYELGDMLICRCNAPLTSIAYSIIKSGRKAIIRGRDIGTGLTFLIEKLQPSSINDLLVKLDWWQGNEISKVAGTIREESVSQQVEDRADCIRALSEDCTTIHQLITRIRNIFDNMDDGKPKDAVVLSSIHKAKGLESDRVFWIKPEITIKKARQDWQQRQEMHLRYVALTRAKSTLFMVYERPLAQAA